MNDRMRFFAVLATAAALLAPVAVAQKPAPTPPPSAPPGRSTNPTTLPNSDPSQPREDLVMFLRGRVAINDGAPVPHDMLVERICNNRVRQEVYASLHGDFSMQLGSRADSFPGSSGDSVSPYGVTTRNPDEGIPRRELNNCELRASASGFHSRTISLIGLDTFGGSSADVGVIVVERAIKAEGTALDATAYKAPKDARKAYEKGLQAEKTGNLADAHRYFEKAVRIYPRFTNAWFRLGAILQKENQQDEAFKAYTQAATIDTKFLAPYLSLALLAYRAGNWREVVDLTGHILELDPLNHAAVTSYILDLDPSNYVDAYFYNAMANYKLNKLEEAERSGLKAEHLDLLTHFPQIHLLLADLFARKSNYAVAIAQIETYLALAPHAQDADQAREQLAKLEKLNGSPPASEKSDPR
jgi:tetratricopeptide (TPR) repeat protein